LQLKKRLRFKIHLKRSRFCFYHDIGNSKWNKIEHRLSAYISKNCRAKPLTSLLVIISLIGATTTTKGLKVTANLDERIYKTGLKVTEEEKEKLNIVRNDFHGEWNYIMSPNL